MEMMQGMSSLDHLPMDITLQLSDGNIKANKMMLGIVSPVFKKMLYGSFKEASSSEVDLPKDNYKIMKLLFDIVFEGSSDLESLDDIIPLMEVVDRYEIKKIPVQHMCDEAILAELDPSNYVSLLQKFTGVMSEASVKEAANKVMSYCNNDFVSSFDKIKDLPEEVLLLLLQRNDIDNPEIELFDFLVKWHDYQTKQLKTLHLISQLFQSIRYFLINPRLLLTKVADCSYVDKQVLVEALDCLYTKPQCDESNKQKAPRHFGTIQWKVISKGSITYDEQKGNLCHVEVDTSGIISSKLKNGIYSFSISKDGSFHRSKIFLSVNMHDHDACLCEIPATVSAADNITVNLFVYEHDIFMKVTKDHEVCATYSATAHPICIIIKGNVNGGLQIIHASEVIRSEICRK